MHCKSFKLEIVHLKNAVIVTGRKKEWRKSENKNQLDIEVKESKIDDDE